ncbi:MAG: SDR family oxidoreductase [Acidimicrobiia bacterium]|nr:SDR family oxidoreductase [Acidimicrobiia bacterium]
MTGGNRGFGAELCRLLLERGAAKVYAGARDVRSISQEGVVGVQLDVTSASDIASAAEHCRDVTLLVNNAGISTDTSILADGVVDAARRDFETNVFGPMAMNQAFAPTLATNGGGAIINVLSVLSWFGQPDLAVYGASKAAGWSLTNSLRQVLLAQHTQVLGLYVAYMDTDMTAGIDSPKSDPGEIAALTLDGLEAGAHEVVADDISRHVRSALSGDLDALYPVLGQ